MSNWPLPDPSGVYPTYGTDASDTTGVQVTGGVRVLSAWVEIVASSDALSGFWVSFGLFSNAQNGYYQVGVGSAGNEVKIFESSAVTQSARHFYAFVPVAVPAGTRIAVNLSNNTTGRTTEVSILGVAPSQFGKLPVISDADLVGFEKAGTSGTHGLGTLIDIGTTAHTKTAWVEIVAATTGKTNLLGLYIGKGGSSATNKSILLDIAIGAAASEVVVVQDLWVDLSTIGDETQFHNAQIWLPISIPAGERLAVRAQSDLITDAENNIDVAFILGR